MTELTRLPLPVVPQAKFVFCWFPSLDCNNESGCLPFPWYNNDENVRIFTCPNVSFWVFYTARCWRAPRSNGQLFSLASWYKSTISLHPTYKHLFKNKMTMYSMLWCFKIQQVLFFCFYFCFCFFPFPLFLSLWLVNSEKEVQFECSDDGENLCLPDFSYLENAHLEVKASHKPELVGVEKEHHRSALICTHNTLLHFHITWFFSDKGFQ